MEWMYAQTRPRFILSSERVFREWSPNLELCYLQGKSHLPEAQTRVEPAMLHHAGQRALHTADWAIPAPILCCQILCALHLLKTNTVWKLPLRSGTICVPPDQHLYCSESNLEETAEKWRGVAMDLSRYYVVIEWKLKVAEGGGVCWLLNVQPHALRPV